MKTLIFGTNGQVGFELIRQLPTQGFEVVSFDSKQADFLNPDQVVDLIKQHQPQVIVNAVAYTKVDLAESESERAKVRQINAVTPGLIAIEAKKIGALLVHYSTDYVFDGEFTEPITESATPHPINFYGLTKLEGETAILESGCRSLIFRISWVYANRGANFYLTMKRLFTQKEILNIVGDQIGAPTPASWVAEMTVLALRDSSLESKLGLYHLSPSGETSWFGFATKILEGLQKGSPAVGETELKIQSLNPITTQEYPTPARRPMYSKMESHTFATQFNVKLPSWSELLAQVMGSVSLQGEKYETKKVLTRITDNAASLALECPKLSLLVAVYNKWETFLCVLASIEKQSFRDFELIVCDDGSGLEFVTQLKSYMEQAPFAIRHIWHEDRGFYKNEMLNRGILNSRSEYLVFLDGDCVLHPQFLEDHDTHRKSNVVLAGRRANLTPGVTQLVTPERIRQGFLQTWWWFFVLVSWWMKDNNSIKAIRIQSEPWFRRLNKKPRGIVGCNFSLHKQDLIDINGFDMSYRAAGTGEDTDIEHRLKLKGVKIEPFCFRAIQYHLYHPLLKRSNQNEAYFQSVVEAGWIQTPNGLRELKSSKPGPVFT